MNPSTGTANPADPGLAAILIVNGGTDPPAGKWLRLCLEQIRRHTIWPQVRLYIWNNNLADTWVADEVDQLPGATLLEADPAEALDHRHAVPLQRLYERASQDGAKYIATLDTDAFPIQPGWLQSLVEALRAGASLAGIWRDELEGGIEPYVHPSCLVTTARFIEENRLRLDQFTDDRGRRADTLAHFTRAAEHRGERLHALKRSNENELHRLIGGVYGGLVYHHGAGSRPGALFWDDPQDVALNRRNLQIRSLAAELAFLHTDRYLDWLQGKGRPGPGALVLGMHRSGTSCLAGSLEQCGMFLGEVNRANEHNPKGNLESRRITRLNEAILAENGGSWDNPPETIAVTKSLHSQMAAALSRYTSHSFWGLKDPRILLTLVHWLELIPEVGLVGTFRHPLAVAESLATRNGFTQDQALALWNHYNQKLIDLHQTRPFPLIEFDLSVPESYHREVASLAVAWGLRPELARIESFAIRRLDHAAGTGEKPVPEECKKIYRYLNTHADRPPITEGSFEDRLLAWGAQKDAQVETSFEDLLAFRVRQALRRLPLPVKRWGRRLKRRLQNQTAGRRSPHDG